MKFTRERKIYAAILGLVALGFGLDRTIYGGSREAANDSATPETALVQASPAAPTANTAIAEEPSLAARLASTEEPSSDPTKIRDPFARQLPWLSAPVSAATVDTAPTLAEQFAARHALTATMGAGQQNGIAIIDGNCLRIGKSIDGFRLLSVDRHSALLESGSTRVKLALKSDVALGQ